MVILRSLSYLILSSTPCESQQGTIISDAFELEQEIQVIHVQIGPRLFADGVWHLLNVGARNSNVIQPLQIQQVSHEQSVTYTVRGVAITVLSLVIFDLKHQSILKFVLWAWLFVNTRVDATRSNGEAETANHEVKDWEERKAWRTSWNTINGGAEQRGLSSQRNDHDDGNDNDDDDDDDDDDET